MKTRFPRIQFLLVLGLLFCAGASAKPTNQEKIDYASSYSFNKLAQSICESTRNDSVIKLRKALLIAKEHIDDIYQLVECDGASLLAYAERNQSTRTIAYLRLKTDLTQYQDNLS